MMPKWIAIAIVLSLSRAGAGAEVAEADGSRYQKAQLWTYDFAGNGNPKWGPETIRMAADMNGDGMADLVGFGNGGVWVALSDGYRFADAKKWVSGFADGWD